MLIRNWSEDATGAALVESRGLHVARFDAMSETRAAFVRPKVMDDKQLRSFPEDEPGAYKPSQDGMVGRLLFAHGIDAHDPEASKEGHFVTM